MIRVAAVGDVHLDEDVLGRYRPALEELPQCADVLLLAGDLTRHGTVAEARCVATEFGGLAVPVIAVLGNHDYHSDQVPEVTGVLEDAGITVLEGAGTVVAARPPTREELIQQDIQELHRLGYAQQLFREMGGFSNFAISLSRRSRSALRSISIARKSSPVRVIATGVPGGP